MTPAAPCKETRKRASAGHLCCEHYALGRTGCFSDCLECCAQLHTSSRCHLRVLCKVFNAGSNLLARLAHPTSDFEHVQATVCQLRLLGFFAALTLPCTSVVTRRVGHPSDKRLLPETRETAGAGKLCNCTARRSFHRADFSDSDVKPLLPCPWQPSQS